MKSSCCLDKTNYFSLSLTFTLTMSSNNASFVLNALSFAKIFSIAAMKDKAKKYKDTMMSVKIDLQECGIIMNKTDAASVKKCSNLLGKAIAKLESLEEKKLKHMIEALIKILKSFEKKKFSFRINSLTKEIALDKSFDQLCKDDDSSDEDSSSEDDSSSDDSSSDDSSSDDSSSDDSSDDSSSDSEDDKKKRKKSTKGKTDKKTRLDIKTLEKYAKVLTSDKRYKHLLKDEKKGEKKAEKKPAAKKAEKKVKFEPIILD